ncbi:MAG: glycoside hydrolase family 31 protein, partial [Bacteroidales bacterium]|nr:glycoside hydrolase family 31 protein [Bacteroidales bacterium]
MKKPVLTRTCYLAILILLLTVSCSKKGMVTIEAENPDSFPVVTISNPDGNDIVIKPLGENTGSIGFETGGQITWLRGAPDETITGENSSAFTWTLQEAGSVELIITKDTDGLSMKIKYLSENGNAAGRWFINIDAADDEYFTGAFERVVDGPQANSWKKGIETAMNLRNEIVVMKVQPTVSAYSPFYLSSSGYGFFVEGTWPGQFDFCKSDPSTVKIFFEGPDFSFSCYLGTPMEIVKKHTLVTGPPFVPPRWAFGPWRWRDDHNNNTAYFDGSSVDAPYNADVVEDVLMMQAYGIPCTAYWIDRPWGPGSFGFDDYLIDYERFPEFENMVTWLNGKNMELMLWICPWVYGDMADTANSRGYNLQGRIQRPLMFPPPPPPPSQATAPGAGPFPGTRQRTPVQTAPERMAIMDYTNPEAARWWGENGPAKLAKMGVKGFKLDRGDGERIIDSLELKTFSGISYRENFNDYSHQFVKATYEAVKPVLDDDFILFPRAQYSGSSRYGAMWAGDTDNSAEGLRSALIAMQRCAVMGYPNWGSDAGGYPQRLDREVTMRWLAFACFSPIMEVGPTNNRGFWGLNSDPSWDHELLAVWHFYTNLRMSLINYVHDLSKNAASTGIPVARPLFLEYPGQAESWDDWTTYKLGEDLLVSLVWEKGK